MKARTFRYIIHKYPILDGKNIYHTNSKKLTIALLKHIFSRCQDKEATPKLFVLTDGGLDTLDTYKHELRKLDIFKDAKFKTIHSGNVDEEREALEGYAKGEIDCDVLLATPCINIGVRLNGLFGAVLIDTYNNPTCPHTSNEVVQMMTRDADCSEIIWQEKERKSLPIFPINWKIPEPADWLNVCQKEWEIISKNIDRIYTGHTNLFERNPLNNSYQPKNIGLLKRTVLQHNWSRDDRENRLENTKEKCIELAANWHSLSMVREMLGEDTLRDINLTQPKYIREDRNKKLRGELEHDADSLAKLYEILADLRLDAKSQHLTAKQLSQWDSGKYIENEERNKELHSVISEPNELNELALQLLQLGKDYGKMKILTDKQFKQSEVYKEYFDGDNFARFQRLAQDSLNIYEPRQLQTELDALKWSGELLRRYNYYPQIKTEAETNPNKERKNLYQQAKKEHSAQFNKWAKTNKTEGKQIRYDDWLWFILNDKQLRDAIKFKPLTKKYIKTFPHLEIQEHTRRFNAHAV